MYIGNLVIKLLFFFLPGIFCVFVTRFLTKIKDDERREYWEKKRIYIEFVVVVSFVSYFITYIVFNVFNYLKTNGDFYLENIEMFKALEDMSVVGIRFVEVVMAVFCSILIGILIGKYYNDRKVEKSNKRQGEAIERKDLD